MNKPFNKINKYIWVIIIQARNRIQILTSQDQTNSNQPKFFQF